MLFFYFYWQVTKLCHMPVYHYNIFKLHYSIIKTNSNTRNHDKCGQKTKYIFVAE